ncbi:hypothetical protein POM88_046661 [Heracleum sosnowskyi]|uniref:Transposase n=1 Tax=Heracleum sosnowskyi TaxID=360622 RepID=A0AAD8H9Q2_9APIA|nr:hypothetical protein POM88_046661 [Heracleum sosnowskyi]
MFDDDDVQYMFESVDYSSLRNYVEPDNIQMQWLRCLKVVIEVQAPIVLKKLRTSESGGASGDISSGSSSRCLSRLDSEGNSRGSSDFRDDDIPFYKSFDGSSMVASFHELVMNKSVDISNASELQKGMMFQTKEELMRVVKDVQIFNHQEIKVVRSDSVTWEVECNRKMTGCVWMLRARKRTIHNFFEIMEIKVTHTCLNPNITQDHYNLNSSNIAHVFSTKIAVDPSVSEKEHDLGEPIGEVVRFKRVFWAFKPYIDAFPHCIPVLLIDGTHLYDKYGGVLLTATAVDGFNHLLPVVFGIVESENTASWTWFMERLGWCEPYSHHRFCSRHLAANFGKEFKKGHIKDRIVPLCSQLTGHKFSLHWNALVAAEPRAQQWFADKPLSCWALAYDKGKRFGIMATNIDESWNSAIKVARKLPITVLVKSIFHKVVTYFDQRRLEIENQCVDGNEFTHHANKMLNIWKERASGHHVKLFDRDNWVFTVTTMKRGQKGGNEQIVRLMEGICTYNARKVYGSAFEPLPDEDAWPLFDKFPMIVPDIQNISNKPGRKKETRYKNEMDFQVSGRNKGTSSSGASSRIPLYIRGYV